MSTFNLLTFIWDYPVKRYFYFYYIITARLYHIIYVIFQTTQMAHVEMILLFHCISAPLTANTFYVAHGTDQISLYHLWHNLTKFSRASHPSSCLILHSCSCLTVHIWKLFVSFVSTANVGDRHSEVRGGGTELRAGELERSVSGGTDICRWWWLQQALWWD